MLTVLCAFPAHAVERLAVLELSGKLPVDDLTTLSAVVRGAVVKSAQGGLAVMTSENMEVMLNDMGIDASCVSEGACEVQTARNLGVEYVVTGQVVTMGGKLVATLNLHETTGGSLVSTTLVTGDTSLDLLSTLIPATAELMTALSAKSTTTAPAPAPEMSAAEKVLARLPANAPPTEFEMSFEGLEVVGSHESPTVGKLVCISPGSFTMGDNGTSVLRHRVSLAAFCAMEHEVTQAEWMSLGRKNPSKFTACGEDCPVDSVKWAQAAKFANDLSSAEGLQPAYRGAGSQITRIEGSNGYRLLTAPEWEAAARGREWSNHFAGAKNAKYAKEIAWSEWNSDETTHPICQLKQNGYGLCDMTGNVSEWTEEGFGRNAFEESPPAPTGDFVRGGSYDDNPGLMFVWDDISFRDRKKAYADVGFRLARSE